ncbi:MAG: DUF4870 domain-containing protein [Luteolibacter sp.]
MNPSVIPPTPPTIPCHGATRPPLPPTDEEKTLAMLCHLLAIFTGFLGPLILWLVKKDESRYVDHHAREALNFQITFFIVFMGMLIATFVLMFVMIGILLIPVIIVLSILVLVAEILAAVAAQNGTWHRYPCSIRFF